MKLDKANVNPDNTSDITLVYKTDLYGYLLTVEQVLRRWHQLNIQSINK